jgi:hypothetical protein
VYVRHVVAQPRVECHEMVVGILALGCIVDWKVTRWTFVVWHLVIVVVHDRVCVVGWSKWRRW